MKQDFINRDIAKFSAGNIALIGMRRLGKTEYLKFRIQTFIKKEMLKLGSNFKLNETLDKIITLNFDDTYFSFIDFNRIESENFYQITLQINEAIEKGEN